MSLLDDLKDLADSFSQGDQDERKRQKKFKDDWDTARASALVPKFREAVQLSRAYPWWSAAAGVENCVDILRFTFKPDCGPTITHWLSFEPNRGCRRIVVKSSLEESTAEFDLAGITSTLVEDKVRQFFKKFLREFAIASYAGWGTGEEPTDD